MCKKAGLLIGWDYVAKRALVTRANCDSWTCPECKQRMKETWMLRAQIGVRFFMSHYEFVDFVTITSHEKLRDFAATEKVWREAWPVLYAALKRRYGSMQYMIIPEKHQDGRMHVHALWTAGATQRWLKDNARKRGLGFMQDVRGIESVGDAARYVSKYVGKDLGDDVPKKFHRVRVSQGWPVIPAPNTANNGLRWEYINGNGALEGAYRECEKKQITLIDLDTGQIFDDVDLGTDIDPNY